MGAMPVLSTFSSDLITTAVYRQLTGMALSEVPRSA